MAPPAERIHATAIAIGERAAIIRGPSGSGKSDLALRCLGFSPTELLSQPVTLVGDDQIDLEPVSTGLRVRSVPNLSGLLEVRGIGVVPVRAVTAEASAVLLVDLSNESEIDRMPDPWPYAAVAGVRLPVLKLAPFAASAPLKLFLALANPHFPDWP